MLGWLWACLGEAVMQLSYPTSGSSAVDGVRKLPVPRGLGSAQVSLSSQQSQASSCIPPCLCRGRCWQHTWHSQLSPESHQCRQNPGKNRAAEAEKALPAVAGVTGFVLDKHRCAFLALWHFEWNQTDSLRRQNKWERGKGKGQTRHLGLSGVSQLRGAA